MHFRLLPALLVVVPAFATAQTPDTPAAAVKFFSGLYDPSTGGFQETPGGRPEVRPTLTANRVFKYLGGTHPDKDKSAAFIMSRYDPATGGFSNPGDKPDFSTTQLGVLAALEHGLPKEKFVKAMDYLKENAKTFEEIRVGAAAVEVWGVKECPFDIQPWLKVGDEYAASLTAGKMPHGARETGSLAAFRLRLGQPLPHRSGVVEALRAGQRPDGAWGKTDETTSDVETTYRVMRAFMLLKEKPKDPAGVRKFLMSCRNADGGFGTNPGQPSSASGTYFYAIVSKWLDELEK
jgi:hypothetical protein